MHSSHSNLVGVHSVEVSPFMITLFGKVQKIFNFFSSSTTRWDKLMKTLAGLIASIQNLRDRGIHNSMKKAEIISKDLDIEASFPIKRKRKAKRMFDDETREESSHIPPEKDFEINCNIVFDSIITQLHWRFETMAEISSDFEFLNGNSLASMSVEDLKKCGDKLCQKYEPMRVKVDQVQFFSNDPYVCKTAKNLL